MNNPKLTIHKSTLLNLYRELEHIKRLIDTYPSELYDPQRVSDEMVDAVYGDDGYYESMMMILDKTINNKEVK